MSDHLPRFVDRPGSFCQLLGHILRALPLLDSLSSAGPLQSQQQVADEHPRGFFLQLEVPFLRHAFELAPYERRDPRGYLASLLEQPHAPVELRVHRPPQYLGNSSPPSTSRCISSSRSRSRCFLTMRAESSSSALTLIAATVLAPDSSRAFGLESGTTLNLSPLISSA